ncbi:DUF3857 domain-containing protein [Mucilaginibacter sp. X4EP1]|uniref:DUF3857 domain-containing protein n=1 Tax=Mucilaginibacter sp. X4EP1 TaxID=2723092 RepID=UPI002169D22D|nr:DUF3857 domain-containing protein [Mucilaginibacter sp. X4EP1]MCS3816446.1 hypothetical protein [Mucilaginibacter sp. X4EP1]
MMYKRYFNGALYFIIALLSVVLKSQAQELPKELYIAANIPDSLKENANSVIRYSDITETVKSPDRITIKYHTIVTILNEKGDREAIMEMHYNKKYDTYSGIEMHVYNEKGVAIKKYHKSDMYDGAADDGFSLVTDDRFLGVKHTVVSYPVTIEQEYEEDLSSFIDLNTWQIQSSEQSVQNTYYHLSIDKNAGLRYMNKNINIKPEKHSVDNIDTYLWTVLNLKAIKPEEGAVSWRVLPKIEFASNYFEYCGVSGNFNTWENYGKWQQGLNSDVCSFTPEREAEIRKMTDTLKTDKEKAMFLYNYMQQNMRYVSIQLGIGGLKPFPATFVDQKKYGDCKALSNYMVAMLKAVHIPAYYAKVKSGENEEPCDPSFPFDISDHIIVCIPFKSDTTWLECTSNTATFGVLGSFTENRNAMIVTESGGKLVNTPRSTAHENQFDSNTHIILDGDGGAKAQIKILGTGEYRDRYISMSSLKTDEQKEVLLTDLGIKQPSVFDFTFGKDANGTKEVDLNLEFDKFCDIKAGDKQFYRPLAFTLWDRTVPILEKRKTDYYFDYPREKKSVTTIDLPQGFEVETLPTNQTLKFTYGNYEVTYTYDAAKNQVTSIAKFNLTSHVIPAAKYTEMQQYLDAVIKAQNKKLVIRRKA